MQVNFAPIVLRTLIVVGQNRNGLAIGRFSHIRLLSFLLQRHGKDP